MELHERIKEAMAYAQINQSRLAAEAGVSSSAISQLMTGKVKSLKADTASSIEQSTGYRSTWLVTGQGPKLVAESASTLIPLVNNPDYPAVRVVKLKANAGVQGYQVEQEVEDGTPIVFRRSWFEKNGYTPTSLIALKVSGQSMEPTFWEDDLIVINTDSIEPRDGHVYVVIYEGETGVKRMVRDDGQWWLVSDNQDSRRFPRKRCHESTKVIGEVVYKQSERF